jgi:hypothetical protein
VRRAILLTVLVGLVFTLRAAAAVGAPRFDLAPPGPATVTVYDVGGRRARTLAVDAAKAGETTLAWDGADGAGRRVGPGVYRMQLRTAGGYVSSKRLVRMD